jgi:hypothetical protein
MAVVLIEKDLKGLFYVLLSDGLRSLRLDLNRQNRSQPVYQPGLAGGFRIDRFDRFIGKWLVGLRGVLLV